MGREEEDKEGGLLSYRDIPEECNTDPSSARCLQVHIINHHQSSIINHLNQS